MICFLNIVVITENCRQLAPKLKDQDPPEQALDVQLEALYVRHGVLSHDL